ncbi:hypothetical protein D3C86_1789930 [compost metagenome]
MGPILQQPDSHPEQAMALGHTTPLVGLPTASEDMVALGPNLVGNSVVQLTILCRAGEDADHLAQHHQDVSGFLINLAVERGPSEIVHELQGPHCNARLPVRPLKAVNRCEAQVEPTMGADGHGGRPYRVPIPELAAEVGMRLAT